MVNLETSAINPKRLAIFLEENLLVAPAFLFSNDTMSVRINYTRLNKEQLLLFKQQFRQVTTKMRKDVSK